MSKPLTIAILALLLMTGCSKDSVHVLFTYGCTKRGDIYYFNEDLHIDGVAGISTVSCENAHHNWYKTPVPYQDQSHIVGSTGNPDSKTGLLP